MISKFLSLKIDDPRCNFSAAHFTLFSKSKRERLHGHRYLVKGTFEMEKREGDLQVNYQEIRSLIFSLCQQFNERVLIPTLSPNLKIELQHNSILASFGSSFFSFPKEDVALLPLKNTSIEELSLFFLESFISASPPSYLEIFSAIQISIGSSPYTSMRAQWTRE